MAAPDFSPVLALEFKAFEYADRGMYARAADKFGAAADAALALSPEDSLVAAYNRVFQIKALLSYIHLPLFGGAHPRLNPEARLVWDSIEQLLSPCTAALQRRLAAKTLLPGACRPAEVAYHAASLRNDASPASVHVLAPHIGYGIFLEAAALALTSLFYLHEQPLTPAEGVSTSHVEVALHAVELLRTCGSALAAVSITWAPESVFVQAMRYFAPPCIGPAEEQLARVWREMEATGLLPGDGIEKLQSGAARKGAEAKACAERRTAARGLHTCALQSCGAREVEAAQFKKCAACQTVVYCCKQHQEQHWPAHKAACKAARKAAAAGAAGEAV
jgi:hypothetical protein